jgi:hypothetical protein
LKKLVCDKVDASKIESSENIGKVLTFKQQVKSLKAGFAKSDVLNFL